MSIKKNIVLQTHSLDLKDIVLESTHLWYDTIVFEDFSHYEYYIADHIPDAIIVDYDSSNKITVAEIINSIKAIDALCFTPIIIVTPQVLNNHELLDLTVSLIYRPNVGKSLIKSLSFYYPFNTPIHMPLKSNLTSTL